MPADVMQHSSFYDFEMKDVDDKSGSFQGYASTFRRSPDFQNDVIIKNAFIETIEESGGRWPVLMAHNTGRVVGFSTGATEDSKGLLVTGEFTLGSDEGRNAHAMVSHAAALKQKFGLSIGYMLRGKNAADFDENTGIRTLKNLTVHEFSLAAIPANSHARITMVKSAGDWTIREFEEHLRDVGFSQQAAKRIAAGGFTALDQRDVDGSEQRMNEAVNAEFCQKLFALQLERLSHAR